jgi:hypothetical protein
MQESNSDGERMASSGTTPNVDEHSETWPVNDPSAVAEVVLAKTPRSSIHVFHYMPLYLTHD